MKDLVYVEDKEQFTEFKSYFSDEGLSITSHTKELKGHILTLSDDVTYHLPPQTWKWIAENKPNPNCFENSMKCMEMIKEFNEKNESPYSNPLIYGKNPMENIVNISVKDDMVHIFQEIGNVVKETTFPMKYWILSNMKPNDPFTKLTGNLHFKYMKEFTDEKVKTKAANEIQYRFKKELYTAWDHAEALMIREGYTYFKGMKVEDVSILSFDIETNKTLDPKLPHSKTLLIANTFRKDGKYQRKLFALDEYKNELCMILDWCKWVREVDPSILTGHNINGFDLYYLHHRLKITSKTQVGFDDSKIDLKGLPLGRNESEMTISNRVSQFRKDGSQTYDYHKVKIFGRNIIDGFFIAIRYDIGRNFPSYGLKPIIKSLGLEKEGRIKWDFEKDDPAKIWEKLNDKQGCTQETEDKWEQYKEYCIDDADDSLKVFDLMIPAQFYLSQNLPQPFQTITETATGRQINSFMIRGYLQQGHSIPKPTQATGFEGAISFGIPGVYNNVFKLDVASLYPSIMRQYKIYDKRKDPLKLFLETVETFTIERLKNKKIAADTGETYYKDLEQSQKVLINSCYGFMGAAGLHFNSPDNAALVTRYGREILTKSIKWATGKSVEFWKEKI